MYLALSVGAIGPHSAAEFADRERIVAIQKLSSFRSGCKTAFSETDFGPAPLDRSGRLVGPEHSSGYNVRMEPSAASRAFQFGANATGDLDAKCRACGSEATIEYTASPPTSKMRIECRACNISVMAQVETRFQVATATRATLSRKARLLSFLHVR